MRKAGNVTFLDAGGALERDGEIESAFCELLSIFSALEATIEGERFLQARDFLVRQGQDHLAALERLVRPHA